MGEGTDRPMGERRRRREAERAAASSGAPQPLTRRELRRREAEEAARLEAIATGELPMDELAERMRATTAPSGSVPSASTGRAETSAGTARSAASAGSAPSTGPVPTTGSALPAASPPRPPAPSTAGSAPSAASAPAPGAPATVGSAPSAASAGHAAVTAGSAPSASSAATAGSVPAATGSRLPSRRSLRERAQDADQAPPERPQERTATGRRPVVRTPSTAQGVRALDSTGRLTGIQPVVRPDAPGRPEPASVTPPTEWGEHDTFSLELDGPARAARAALPAERAPDTADEPPEEDEELPLRPQWVAIDHISGASPEDAKSDLPSRRNLRRTTDEETPAAAPARRDNPAVTAVKVAVLVLVALVIGALIWLLATEAFSDGDGDAGASGPAATAPTFITTPHPEETRAR